MVIIIIVIIIIAAIIKELIGRSYNILIMKSPIKINNKLGALS